MKLTLKKLIFATVAFIILDIAYIWIRNNYGITEWISPKTLTYWSKELALVIAWGIFLVGKIQKEKTD